MTNVGVRGWTTTDTSLISESVIVHIVVGNNYTTFFYCRILWWGPRVRTTSRWDVETLLLLLEKVKQINVFCFCISISINSFSFFFSSRNVVKCILVTQHIISEEQTLEYLKNCFINVKQSFFVCLFNNKMFYIEKKNCIVYSSLDYKLFYTHFFCWRALCHNFFFI